MHCDYDLWLGCDADTRCQVGGESETEGESGIIIARWIFGKSMQSKLSAQDLWIQATSCKQAQISDAKNC